MIWKFFTIFIDAVCINRFCFFLQHKKGAHTKRAIPVENNRIQNKSNTQDLKFSPQELCENRASEQKILLFLFVGFVFSHFFHYAKVFPIDVELYVFCFALYSSQIQTVFVGKIVALPFCLVCLKRWHWFFKRIVLFIHLHIHSHIFHRSFHRFATVLFSLTASLSLYIFILAIHNGGKKD